MPLGALGLTKPEPAENNLSASNVARAECATTFLCCAFCAGNGTLARGTLAQVLLAFAASAGSLLCSAS